MTVVNQLFDLTGMSALVTGAGRGLGWEVAKALAQSGATVFANGRNANPLDAKIASGSPGVGKITTAIFDVTDADAVEDWMASTGKGLNILVNNVGLRHRQPVESCPPEDFQAMLDVNLTAPYRLARTAARIMGTDHNAGNNIINITSIAGPRARSNDAAYTAAKGGLEALTRALAMELAPNGIRVNAIAPGFFATETNQKMVDDPDIQKFVAARIPVKRWGQPAEIGGAAVFLASRGASYVNGHVLTVDAGLSVNF